MTSLDKKLAQEIIDGKKKAEERKRNKERKKEQRLARRRLRSEIIEDDDCLLLKIKRRRFYTWVIRLLLPGYLAATLFQLASLLGLFEPVWRETFSNGLNMAMIGMNLVMMVMFASFTWGAYLALRRPKWSLRVTKNHYEFVIRSIMAWPVDRRIGERSELEIGFRETEATIRGKGWKCYIEKLGREDIEVIAKFSNLISPTSPTPKHSLSAG
jgi:hypothetical protein